MESIIFILILVLFAYMGAGLVFKSWRLPFFISSFLHAGVGFILMGVAVGPLGMDWLNSTRLDLFIAPTSIILSWAGLMFGLQFRVKSLRLISRANFKIAVIQSLVVFFFCCLFLLPLRYFKPDLFLSLSEELPVVFALAAIASISAPTAVSAVVRRMRAHGTTARTLLYVSASDAIVGISLFGISLSFFKMDTMVEGAFVQGFIWLLITIGLGFLLGILYHVFLKLRLSSNERLVIAIGIVVMLAGAASTIDVSPLFLSMIVGIVLNNFSDDQDRLLSLLSNAEKPLFGMMLILAGAYWMGFESFCVLLSLFFVVIRIVAKMLGSRVAFWAVPLMKGNPNLFGLSLLEQGGLSIAMSLDFLNRYPGMISQIVVSAVVIAFVINGVASSYFIRLLLNREEGIA
ncbi:MAG: hypothetical protein HN337_04955 [Deltaproteobacteria bacterium]|jgi:Kef-type K+ transport system membrane component KefB|nr:hypothetical protein [Deltaproteobacteria bacterium]